MDTTGGMGTLNPPGDGDDIAEVVPLRRRDGHLVAVPVVRDPLPAENSVWDTDDQDGPMLRRSWRRRFAGPIGRASRWAVGELARRPRAALSSLVVLLCLAGTTVAVLGGSHARALRPRTAKPTTLVASGSKATPAHRTPARPATVSTKPKHARRVRRARQGHRHAGAQRSSRRARSEVHTSTPAAPVSTVRSVILSTTARSTPIPAPTVSPARAASEIRKPSRSPGPTGSGAAFGPGY